jgi:hypothetical protein
MKKIILLAFVATCFLSCTKDATATLDPNGRKNNTSNSLQRSPTMDPDGKSTSPAQYISPADTIFLRAQGMDY